MLSKKLPICKNTLKYHKNTQKFPKTSNSRQNSHPNNRHNQRENDHSKAGQPTASIPNRLPSEHRPSSPNTSAKLRRRVQNQSTALQIPDDQLCKAIV
jgi:hypothetical protein